MNPLCSCTECDSVSCFAKRQTDAPCSCRTCSNSKSCLFYNRRTNISESKSGLLNYNDTEIAAENITRELVKKEMIYEFDKNKTTITKKQSRYSYKTEKGSKDRIEKESKNLCTQRATNSPKEKEESSPTARLSAQIMDVPCNDFENSILKLNNRSKMSPFNIFNRIKEAYKACSCKVCECIVGKSMQNDHCSCKPCECNDCGNFNRHVESFKYSGRLDPKDDKDCPCNKCDRVSCKGIGKDKNEGLNYCDCLDWLSSDYLKDDNSLTKDCKCEPCQCMVCKPRLIHSHKTFIVAPVGQEQQSSVCQCSPCECFECRRTFGLTSNLHREMSTTTSMTRYPHCHCEMCSNDACLLDSNQSCRCQRFSKVMSKPVQQDSHEYDIRRATVTYDDAQRHRDKYKSEDCFKERYSDEFIYPVKRGEPLNPSMFRNKIKDAFIESCMRTVEVNEEILKQPIALKSPMKKQLALSSTQETKNLDDFNIGASYQKCFRDKYVNHQMFPQNITRTKPVQESFKHAQISKCADSINFRCRNIEPALDSNLSANSSLSFHKESGSITPSRSRLKSWKSSSNGCPSKLIHFPKTAVETYLNDVIQLDNNNSNLSTMPLTLKNSLQKQNIPDLHLNFWGHSKYQPMRTNFSEEKPTDNMNSGTRTEENVFFKYSVQNHENNPYIPQNFDQYNVSKSKDKLTKIMKTSFPKIQEKHSASMKNNDLVNFTIEDYERVQNTLKEARACTSMLAQLLKKYEKANKEFNSVNKKKNKSNESPLNQIDISKRANTKDLKYLIYMDDEPRKEHSLKVTSKLLTEKTAEICKKANVNNYDHVSNEPDHSFIDEADNIVYENITTHGTCDGNNEGRDESGDDIIKNNDDLIKPITVEKEPIDKIIAKMLHKKYNKMRSRSIISSKRIKRFTDKSSVEISLPTETNNNAIKQNNRPFGQKTIIDKNIEEDVTEVNLPEIAQGVNLQKSTKESRVSKTEKNSIDSPILQKDVFMIKQPEVGDEFTWPVFKKTFCFDTELYSTDRRLSLLTPLEKNIKAVAETISTQLVGENAMYFYENKALVKLQFEVKKILDMPILQTYGSFMSDQKDKQDPRYNLSNTTFTQTNQGSENEQNMQKSDKMPAMELISSCEAMKVNFLNVRRVSDHTILIKWNYPRQLHNVRGYELLVDGRAVQKMFTSSRRMAVLTCISHSDRILLTVRTVPYSPCPDHSPAVTVIYRPKPKVKFI